MSFYNVHRESKGDSWEQRRYDVGKSQQWQYVAPIRSRAHGGDEEPPPVRCPLLPPRAGSSYLANLRTGP